MQVTENGYMAEHPARKSVRLAASPVQYNNGTVGFRSGAPALGEHTEDILVSLGYERRAIQEMKAEGIIAQSEVKA
jgi:crotonobetainyl-CoA:carnitine CoA-transferase CaiB-like acyl-CoA transferase